MHEFFLNWVKKNQLNFEKMGIKVELNGVRRDIPDPKVSFSFSSTNCMSTMTVWKSKLVDFEVLDFNSQKRVLYYYREIKEEGEFDSIIHKMIELVAV
ncbi:immunity protein TriTu family protein [Marininema halotolerans]|uniref:Uncharacterized protein n=1 Tax=Marininema halotolerans TaxID=1155944 RepID=A0A1I6ULX2_9BACL|nr:hypothetical protein [Marininema halotolerans]SFT02459.1 hypothetical protein SAMN05444972_11817 [Marininema halotolerans]